MLSVPHPKVTQPVGCSARAREARTAVQRRGTEPFARSRADVPEMEGSLVGLKRTRLPTIVVVPLGRLAARPEPGSAMLGRLAVQYRVEVD
jgi:hypothetical protein